jgi:hypothetical protein
MVIREKLQWNTMFCPPAVTYGNGYQNDNNRAIILHTGSQEGFLPGT